LLLSIVVLIAIWCHTSSRKPANLFLRIGIYLWTIANAAHWVHFAFRNFVFSRPFATAVAMRLSNRVPFSQALVDPSNVFQVDIIVPRPWHVKAGQFIFLSIPRLGIFNRLRGHPFMISWCERGRQGLTISLLVKSRSGFTTELDRHANKKLLMFGDGLYGVCHDFGEYGTMVMFATGIGIAGYLPYIEDLMSGYNLGFDHRTPDGNHPLLNRQTVSRTKI
jgi:predicted ferric reductase